MVNGIDALGLAHPLFRVQNLIQAVPEGLAIGVFDDPFGDVLPKLRRVMQTHKYPAVRIHAHWSNQHVIVPEKKLKEKLPRYQKLAVEFPQIKIYVSHSCEHNGSLKDARRRVDMIEEMCPNAIAVNSVYKGALVAGCVNEKHGSKPKVTGGRYIVSTDGVNSYDIDALTYNSLYEEAEIAFHWGMRLNLREVYKPGQSVPPPNKRNATPSVEYIRSLVRLCYPVGAIPQPAFNAIPLKKPHLWKTHSEDHPIVENRRENTPVLIVNEKDTDAVVVAWNGKKVCTLDYGGVFAGGQHRYYADGIYGFKMSDKARRISDSEYLWIRVGDKTYGPVHGAFRIPYYLE